MDGVEVRRVNIIYFLSRDGKVEHPHLIQVHHLHRHGVRLHDVKRWMADLRGKGMPELYAWSYKRRYKKGFVWLDLMTDDALITPVADNEYVIKGSYILEPLSPKKQHLHLLDADEHLKQREQLETDCALKPHAELGSEASQEEKRGRKGEESSPETVTPALETMVMDDDDVSPKPLLRLEQDSPERGNNSLGEEELELIRSKRWQPAFGKGVRASHVLRNILTCRMVYTDDSALIPISKHHNYARIKPEHDNSNATSKARDGRKCGRLKPKAATAAEHKYRPVGAPNCS